MDTRVGERLEGDLECVGVVKEPLRCVDICLELRPDVLILDRTMPGVDGLRIPRVVRSARPRALTV